MPKGDRKGAVTERDPGDRSPGWDGQGGPPRGGGLAVSRNLRLKGCGRRIREARGLRHKGELPEEQKSGWSSECG